MTLLMPEAATVTSMSELDSLKERLDKMAVLLDVAKVMGSERNLDALLTYIAEQVTYVTESDRCSLFLLDFKTNELWAKVALKARKEIRFPADKGIVGHTVTTGEIVNISAPYEDSRFNRQVDIDTGYRTRNLICLPLKNLNNKIIGALQVLNKLDGPFTETDREFLQIFCAQAAVAIENAQLYREKEQALQEIRDKVRQLDILYKVEKEANLSGNIDSFVSGVLANAADALGAESGLVLLPSRPKAPLLIRFTHDPRFDSLRGKEVEAAPNVARECLDSLAPLVRNNPSQDDAHLLSLARAMNASVRNVVAAPLREDGQAIGVLELINRKSGRFTPEDERLVDMIATQVSTAINRLHLIEEKHRGQRLVTVGQMAGSIIHDFKNPMAIIRGLGELLQKDQLPEEKRTRFANIIIGEVDRCVNMTKDILEYCRGEKNFRFQIINSQEFVDGLGLILEQDFDSANIGLETSVDYVGPLRLDLDKMKRVIFNISNNARSVMRDGGLFSIGCRAEGDEAILTLADSGPGIPREIQATLFQPFVTMGKKHGTGLGLAIVAEIIEAHGGQIELVDIPDRGAAFAIRLKIPTQEDLEAYSGI